MYVYVVSEGEKSEGSTPVAAARTLQGARDYVKTRYGRSIHPVDVHKRGHWWCYKEDNNRVDLILVDRIRIRD